MSAPRPRAVSAELLAAYVDGDVTPSQASAIARAIEESPDLRRRADELRRITATLSSPIEELESLDVAASVRAATAAIDRQRAQQARAPRVPWLRRWSLLGLATTAALAVGLLVVRPARRSGDGAADEAAGLRAKSASTAPASAPERWAGIGVYRVTEGGPPQRVGERISRDDGLLFTYTNLGTRPFAYLMIFAVDGSGQVRWFYPAYQEAGTNPASIAIQANANVPLAEVVRHPFATGPAAFQALFSRRPLRVEEVESWLARRPAPNGAPPWPETYRQIVMTSVEAPR
ncbi:MAG TPA: hypothetical protein VHM31_24995 [Polyangia bacterium]|nr:hypothetical protein [Polyangia bacterium]